MRMTTRSLRLRSAKGISLTEVLISMGIMAVGLMGVAALFPVGGHYLRQSEVSDRADAMAQAAFSDAVARGLLDPDRWLQIRRGQATRPWTSVYDGSFTTNLMTQLSALPTANDPALANQSLNTAMGSVFVVDPLGVAESMDPARASSNAAPAGFVAGFVGYLPASHDPKAEFTNNTAVAAAGWYPWQPDDSWPVRRLTVTTGANPVPRRPIAPMPGQARALVAAEDDLALEFGDDADRPVQQLIEQSGGVPLVRQAKGDFSWLLTIVPTTTSARNALATDPSSFNYDVSAVVFHKRTLGGTFVRNDTPFHGHDSISLAERQARAAVASTGIAGGQMRFFTDASGEMNGPTDQESPMENLEAGQWVMLFGPHPDSSSTEPLLFCQWYRVVAVDGEDDADGDNRPDPFVFLRGPDWPWGPNGDQTDPSTGIQNDLRVVIMPDVAAVHTRTMKLSAGSAWDID